MRAQPEHAVRAYERRAIHKLLPSWARIAVKSQHCGTETLPLGATAFSWAFSWEGLGSAAAVASSGSRRQGNRGDSLVLAATACLEHDPHDAIGAG